MRIKDSTNYTCLDTMNFWGGNVLSCDENKVAMQKTSPKISMYIFIFNANIISLLIIGVRCEPNII